MSKSDTVDATNPLELEVSGVIALIWGDISGVLTDFVLLDLVLLPGVTVLVVEEDSLKDVIFEWLLVVQLVLEVGAIETHFLRGELIGTGHDKESCLLAFERLQEPV